MQGFELKKTRATFSFVPRTALLFFVAFLFLPAMAGTSDSHPPALTVVLRPASPDAENRIPYVDISLTYLVPSVPAGQPFLKMPLLTSNVVTVAKVIEDLSVSDATGPVSVTVEDDPESGEVTYRHWISSRATNGALIIRYRAPISNIAAPRGAAPPLELRSDSGAFSGAGETFLLQPEADITRTVQIHWDLAAAAKGAIGVSSLGEGDVTTREPNGLRSLRHCYFMGGKVELYPQAPPATGFFSAWHGTAPFDLRGLMASERKLYDFYGNFFHRLANAPYGVFLRENPVNAGGGMELSGSFVATFGPTTQLDDLKITLAHEMLHTFVGALDKPEGLLSSWFSEGMAVYYARLLAWRAGQITTDQFLRDLNTTAARYYTDALISTPNSEIPARFWADTRVRVLPYDRGSMYFAVVDEQVRAVSGGKRSLDDLLLAMLKHREQGRLDQSEWLDLLTEQLGQKGREEFEAMLSGAIQLPGPGAFGPCFTRTTKMLRRYQLGFDPKVLVEPKRIIRGLIPGSAAELAGIRNGDEITQPVSQDRIQGEQDGVLTLRLLRDGKPLEISYLPRGETVEAYQWTRTGNLPDSDCVY
jgi:M61 glycyl aminopeptidase